jgi:hypothetical protein
LDPTAIFPRDLLYLNIQDLTLHLNYKYQLVNAVSAKTAVYSERHALKYMLGSFFDTEDGCNVFLRNAG